MGDANASGSGGEASAAAVAEVAQEQNVSIAQVNECLNDAADNGAPGDTTGDTTIATKGKVPLDVISETIPEQRVLADTGGPLILLPALGLLFVTAGVTVLRILLRR